MGYEALRRLLLGAAPLLAGCQAHWFAPTVNYYMGEPGQLVISERFLVPEEGNRTVLACLLDVSTGMPRFHMRGFRNNAKVRVICDNGEHEQVCAEGQIVCHSVNPKYVVQLAISDDYGTFDVLPKPQDGRLVIEFGCCPAPPPPPPEKTWPEDVV